jgi:predicted RNase H-like nuclease (RuvC/YqgF family)
MEDKKEFYMGIDIESGSPLSKENHKFTAIILDKDLKMVNKINSISLSSLIRLAWEWKPKSIATDNVFEIVPDEKSLSKFLSLLPPQTDLIQVTINEGKFVELKEVAKQLNLEVDQTKLSPSKTAYLAAVIASKGKGVKIGFSNEKTQIIVSKGRWSRSGGMSQGRYQRRIRASVNIAANKINASLF